MEKKKFNFGRLIPVVILVAGLVAFFWFGGQEYLSWESLKEHRASLKGWVGMQGFIAGLVFAGVYALATAFSIPGGLIMTLVGGFLFGPWLGTLYVVAGATVGALAVFLAAKFALGDLLRDKAGGFIKRMEAGFQDNALNYMFVLRLIPAFPFWVVNLVPAFLNVSTSVYLLGTFFGIMPGSFVYASVGAGLEELIAANEQPGLSTLLKPEVGGPIVGLIILALIPVIYKKIKAKKA